MKDHELVTHGRPIELVTDAHVPPQLAEYLGARAWRDGRTPQWIEPLFAQAEPPPTIGSHETGAPIRAAS
jgi:hypothetical protein